MEKFCIVTAGALRASGKAQNFRGKTNGSVLPLRRILAERAVKISGLLGLEKTQRLDSGFKGGEDGSSGNEVPPGPGVSEQVNW